MLIGNEITGNRYPGLKNTENNRGFLRNSEGLCLGATVFKQQLKLC